MPPHFILRAVGQVLVMALCIATATQAAPTGVSAAATPPALLRQLARDNGLIFVFRSDCPYCHRMAPIVKAMQRQYGLEVLPVSTDGRGLPDYPSPRPNAGQVDVLGVKQVPALFIANRATGELAPIGFGVMSASEIASRIFAITGTSPAAPY